MPVHAAECHVVHFRERQQLPALLFERFKDLLPPTLVQTRRTTQEGYLGIFVSQGILRAAVRHEVAYKKKGFLLLFLPLFSLSLILRP